MFTANCLSTIAPARQVGESSLERGDFLFQTLPSLPKLETERGALCAKLLGMRLATCCDTLAADQN